jgi:hypothetical protein
MFSHLWRGCLPPVVMEKYFIQRNIEGALKSRHTITSQPLPLFGRGRDNLDWQ